MKTLLLISAILVSTVAWTQTNKIESKVKNLESIVKVLNDSISQLNTNVEQYRTEVELEKKVLEQRIIQATETISNQNSLMSGFGTMYTVITILIGVLALILTIITYQFGIKPSQDALKDFEKNANQKFQDFLAKSRDTQIDQAIDNLKSDSPEQRSNAISFLTLTQHEGFTEPQLFKIYQLLKSDKLDNVNKGTIAFVIANKKSDYATDYFKEAVKKSEHVNVKFAAARYFVNAGINEHLDVFRDLIEYASDQNTELISLLAQLANESKEAVQILINDQGLIDKLSKEVLKQLSQSIPHMKASWQLTEAELEDSLLYKIAKLTARNE